MPIYWVWTPVHTWSPVSPWVQLAATDEARAASVNARRDMGCDVTERCALPSGQWKELSTRLRKTHVWAPRKFAVPFPNPDRNDQ